LDRAEVCQFVEVFRVDIAEEMETGGRVERMVETRETKIIVPKVVSTFFVLRNHSHSPS